jgi:hypothetical protein
MSRKIYNRLSFMAVSWLDESTLMYSLISLTEPLKEEQWRAIGWQRYESLASNRFIVDYLTRTADGRILFGSWGAPYAFSFTHQ